MRLISTKKSSNSKKTLNLPRKIESELSQRYEPNIYNNRH